MKNLKYLFLFGLVGLFAACGESDLEIEPEQELSTDAAFSDENTARASLAGVYSRMQSINVYGSIPQIIEDYQSDNVNFIGSFPTLQDINQFLTIADNATIANVWRDHFRTVLAANAVIANTQGTEDVGFSDEEKAEVIAEGQYLRALSYFNLVRLFAQPYTLDGGASPGVSIIEEPYILTGGEADLSRKSVAEVYDFIESDLLDAFNALDWSSDKYSASKGSAAGLLSRLYLYKGDNAQAITFADEVLGNENYAPATNYDFYDNNGPEQVFSISNTAVDNGREGAGGWAEYYNPAAQNGRGDCPYSEDLIATYDPADARFQLAVALDVEGFGNLRFTQKFPDALNHSDDSPVQRVSELLLNKAEAIAKTSGVTQEAVDAVNVLRTRAGISTYTTADFASGDEFLEAVLLERRLELAFEGHRRSDLLRNGMSLRQGEEGTAPGDTRVVLPIPQREIDLDSNTPQNSGY